MYSMGKLVLLLLFLSSVAFADEREYQNAWCASHGGITEYVLDDSTRVDCLTKHYAIEFDFDHKWAEAIGQSLFYALKTNRRPGIVLILGENEQRYLKRLQTVAKRYRIRVWTLPSKE